MNYLEIRTECCQANKQLPATGLVDLTFGNVSVFDADAQVFAIKPSGVGYAELTPESMVIVERFAELDALEVSAVLVRNHGPFAWGKTAAKAVETALALEIVADMALGCLQLNRSAAPAPDYLRQKHFGRKHGSKAYYGQPS